jgi:hypothetical protein
MFDHRDWQQRVPCSEGQIRKLQWVHLLDIWH